MLHILKWKIMISDLISLTIFGNLGLILVRNPFKIAAILSLISSSDRVSIYSASFPLNQPSRKYREEVN